LSEEGRAGSGKATVIGGGGKFDPKRSRKKRKGRFLENSVEGGEHSRGQGGGARNIGRGGPGGD